jgi:hypothetical protein
MKVHEDNFVQETSLLRRQAAHWHSQQGRHRSSARRRRPLAGSLTRRARWHPRRCRSETDYEASGHHQCTAHLFQHQATVPAPNDTSRRPRNRRPERFGHARASNDDGPRGRTLATLKGRYVFAFSTTLLPPAFGVTQPTPSNAAGFNILNGDGTGTDTVTLTIGGHVVLENVVVPTSYVVNADCTAPTQCSCPMGHPSISSSHLMASNSQASSRVLPAIQGRALVGKCHTGRNSKVIYS